MKMRAYLQASPIAHIFAVVGNIPPAEAEAAYYVQLEATPMAA